MKNVKTKPARPATSPQSGKVVMLPSPSRPAASFPHSPLSVTVPLTGPVPAPPRSPLSVTACGRATSPPGEASASSFFGPKLVVRRSFSGLSLTTHLTFTHGLTLGSPRGGAAERSEAERGAYAAALPCRRGKPSAARPGPPAGLRAQKRPAAVFTLRRAFVYLWGVRNSS